MNRFYYTRGIAAFRTCAVILAVISGWNTLAEPVTKADAEYAAERWAQSGAALDGAIGGRVVSSETLSVTNDVVLHAVHFEGGTAFVSGDTELEPIVAFTSSRDFKTSEGSPLWALLKRDAIVRRQILKAVETSGTKKKLMTAGSNQSSVATRWERLLAGKTIKGKKLMASSPENKIDGVSDIRRAPLLKSQWNQTYARGEYCYNYYTPGNFPCGCTATAMAQIMRYFEYPVEPVAAKTRECKYCSQGSLPLNTNLTMQGGVYDWSMMTLCPEKSEFNEDCWREIGKLTADVSISLRSTYLRSSTSSYTTRIGQALMDDFGYDNAMALWNWGIAEEAGIGDGRVHSQVGLHYPAIREKIIFANLDAGCPVGFGIYGYSSMDVGNSAKWCGHSIVGDGYGYSDYSGEPVAYVHLNLGWSGLDDAWYNLPEIYSPNSGATLDSSGTAFTVLSSVVYNIFPTNTGNIVSGRVVDDQGVGMSGVEMTIRRAGEDVAFATRLTDANGIYAFIVPGGAMYDIDCDYPGAGKTTHPSIYVASDTMEVEEDRGVYTAIDGNVGNYWGHDADFEYDLTSRGYVAVPSLSPPPGKYVGQVEVALASATDGAVVRYTLDGNDPNESSPAYAGPILINSNCTVKARAYKAELTPSRVLEAFYTISRAPTTFLVRQDGTGDFTTISAAIENCVDHDAFIVGPGVYYENVAPYANDLQFISESGPSATIIDAGGASVVFNPNGDGCSITGFTLQNGYNSVLAAGGGAKNGVLTNCVIRNCVAGCGGGASDCVLVDCVISNCIARGYSIDEPGLSGDACGGGAFYSRLKRCLVVGNHAIASLDSIACWSTGGGIDSCTAEKCTVVSNSISGVSCYGADVFLYNYSDQLLDSIACDVSNDYDGTMRNCIITGDTDPKFVDPANGDFRLKRGSPCLGAAENDGNIGWYQGPGISCGWTSPDSMPGDDPDERCGAALIEDGFSSAVAEKLSKVGLYNSFVEWANNRSFEPEELTDKSGVILAAAYNASSVPAPEDVHLNIVNFAAGDDLSFIVRIDGSSAGFNPDSMDRDLAMAALTVECTTSLMDDFTIEGFSTECQSVDNVSIAVTVRPEDGYDSIFIRVRAE